jgi:hypothetical protein
MGFYCISVGKSEQKAMTTPYDPTENAIDAAVQRMIDAGGRCPKTQNTKQQSKSLYTERLLDALHGRNVTYVCSNKQDAAKLKRDIEAADAQIRKDIGK